MDIFYISINKSKHSLLHIIDEGTYFRGATKPRKVDTNSIWHALIKCWASIYTGLPNRTIVDQGSSFGDSFILMAELDDFKVERTYI